MADLNIPYDSDFDERPLKEKQRGGVTPRLAFVIGLITSVLVAAAIGFVILLILLFR